MPIDPACIFCKIIAGNAEASVIFQDDFVTVFMDINPVIQGHSLVVPNEHYSNLSSVDQVYAEKMFITSQRIGNAIRASELRCEGINLFMADGRVAGQTVFHSHLHVIPRFAGDGFSIRFPKGYGLQPARTELDRIAGMISTSLHED